MTKEEVENFVDEMIEDSKKPTEILMVDPPSGWMYGFPKPYPLATIDSENTLNEWLIANGYPKEEIERCGKYFPVRFWTM